MLGLQLGDAVRLPACPQPSLFELGSAQNVATTCIKSGGLVDELVGMAAELNRQRTGEQTIPWDFTAVLPIARCQDWISSCEFSGRLVEGRLVDVFIGTTGLDSQEEAFRVLTGKYGRPTSRSELGYRNRSTGAQLSSIEAEWRLPGLHVIFSGYLGGETNAGGRVLIRTESAARRSGAVQRANEAQKQQL